MKDFPVFTTEHGVASVVISQIPYTGCAYVTIQSSTQPLKLLEDCKDFCCAVGAQAVFASGDPSLTKYPLHTQIVQMRCRREMLNKTDALLVPVRNDTINRFREIYNEAMKAVDNASYMRTEDSQKLITKRCGYFVYQHDELLGIGIAENARIDAIVAVVPHAGQHVLSALNCTLSGEWIEVEVASTNLRAVRFYEKMGFVHSMELSSWYKII